MISSHGRDRVPREEKEMCKYFFQISESILYFPLAKICHMVKLSITQRGNDQRHVYRKMALFRFAGAIWEIDPSLFIQQRASHHLHSRPVPAVCTNRSIGIARRQMWLAAVSHFCPQLMMFKDFGFMFWLKQFSTKLNYTGNDIILQIHLKFLSHSFEWLKNLSTN